MVPNIQELARGRGLLLTDYRLLRRQRRIEAVLVMDQAVLVFGTDPTQVGAASVDLADFHAGSQGVPIIPVVMVDRQRVVAQRPLPLPGAAPPILCTRLLLPWLLDEVARFPAIPGFNRLAWSAAPYRPVPGLIEAACRLYADHDITSLLVTTTDHGDLARTRQTVLDLMARARRTATKQVIFVTGAPGTGKTLCGLDLAFQPGSGAVFLTGNPSLVHVLRAALVRDAGTRGLSRRAARQRVEAMVQPLHQVRDHLAHTETPPPERVFVIDEAQRCWTASHATRKTRNRSHPLTLSEPAFLLDAMARHDGFAAIVCLVGSGQEIHAGEGGLAGWSEALANRPAWHAAAPPNAPDTTDPRQRVSALPNTTLEPALHLGAPVRAWRAPRAVAWVDAVLANDANVARRLAGDDLPIQLTRSRLSMQAALRSRLATRPPKRAGLVASAGARRLRAEGLGGLLWHQDEDAVASWFLETWPDIRSADALEVAATEFGAQGLELDHVGLCWDADLVRTHDDATWQARSFRATAWTVPKDPEILSNRLNTYRVLMTRARHSTVIWVPRGAPSDTTRDPARYDLVAAYLQACGARPLDAAVTTPEDATMPGPSLL